MIKIATEGVEKVSFNTVFSNYEDVINFLKNHDSPTCFRVNYRPKEDDYEIWIGNQPYESYDEMIEDIEESLHIARVGRRDLTNYVKQLKEEIESWRSKAQRFEGEVRELVALLDEVEGV